MTVSSVADHYGILIQDMADAALVVDAMGRCAAANSAAESLLGFEREKLLGCQISELLVDPAEWLLPDSSCATAVESQARHGDLLIRSGTGKHLALKAWASRLHGTAAGATLLLLHHERERSTAERRAGEGQPPTGTEALSLAKQSLHESEARFRSAFDASSIGMALVSPEGRFLQVNPALCRIVGYTRAELLARTFQEITHPDDIETDRESRKQLLADEITTYQIEKKYLRKSGEVITGRLTASLVRGPEGEPLYFVAQVQDITQFKASGAALREAEARYRTLVEQIPAVVYIDDASALGSPVYVSPRIEPMLGYTPGEWLQPYLWTERLHPDDSERVLAAIAEANRTFRPLDLEYRILARDGRLVWVRDEASLLHDDDGNPQVWHGMMIDITDRKAAEEELRAAKEAAEEASRLKSSILSMATHELRTPLTIISGYVELLAESARENLTPEERDYLEITQNGARTLAALVDDLLDLARIEAGKMDLVIRPVDAGEVIERVRRLVAAQAAAKDLTLEVLIEPGTPKIAADINRLAQILLNIFGNAIKFTTQGFVRGEVRGVAGGVEFSVTDTGIGIAPDAITRIFDEFRQEDSGTTRRFGGTGLGLAIVRRLVDMHHGTISVQSEQGVGSRFALWFPSADPEQFEDDLVPSPDLAITH